MALSDPYCNVVEYKQLENVSTNDRDAAISLVLSGVSRMLDRKLSQPYGFNKDTAVTDQTYRGDGSRVLVLTAPVASASGFLVRVDEDNDDDFTDDTDEVAGNYDLMPAWALTGPEPRPYTELWLPTHSTRGYWPGGLQVRVTAIHGWPAVPVAIKIATAKLTAMVLGDSIFATGRINELDAVVDASPQARAIVNSLYETYSRFPIGIG